jgi:hypothetical protein
MRKEFATLITLLQLSGITLGTTRGGYKVKNYRQTNLKILLSQMGRFTVGDLYWLKGEEVVCIYVDKSYASTVHLIDATAAVADLKSALESFECCYAIRGLEGDPFTMGFGLEVVNCDFDADKFAAALFDKGYVDVDNGAEFYHAKSGLSILVFKTPVTTSGALLRPKSLFKSDSIVLSYNTV